MAITQQDFSSRGGGEIVSEKRTTQGEPLSMAFHALVTVTMIRQLGRTIPRYSNNSGEVGQLVQLRVWLETVIFLGQMYGYNLNAGQTVLLVKPALLRERVPDL